MTARAARALLLSLSWIGRWTAVCCDLPDGWAALFEWLLEVDRFGMERREPRFLLMTL